MDARRCARWVAWEGGSDGICHPPAGEAHAESSQFISPFGIIDDEAAAHRPELYWTSPKGWRNYCCGWGEALKFALPSHREKKTVERFRLSEAGRLEAAFEEGGLGLPGLKPSEGKGSHKARILVALRKAPRTLHSLAASFGRGTRPELMRLVDAGFVEKIVDEVGGSKQRMVKYARLRRMQKRMSFRIWKNARSGRRKSCLLDRRMMGGCGLDWKSLERRAHACEALEKKDGSGGEGLLPDRSCGGVESKAGAPLWISPMSKKNRLNW